MIKIRKGTLKDLPQIRKCLLDSWVWHAKNVPELLNEERMRKSDIEGYYKKAFENPDTSFIFIAEVGGKFAGVQRADIKEIAPFFRYHKILYLDDAYVLPEFRRIGVASELIKEAEKKAKELGIKRLQGRVYNFNKPTQKLLIKLGFTSPHATWDKIIS